MAEFWLVSAPGDPRPEDTWNLIKERTGSLTSSQKFTIPGELKVNRAQSMHCMSALELDLLIL